MTNNLIGCELDRIWQNPNFKDFCNNKYLYPEIKPNMDLLFIGINPSYNPEHLNINSYVVDEKNNKNSFFKKYEEVANETDCSWTHIDLFYFRETVQNKIEIILKSQNGPEFLFWQLQLTDKLIKYANPKIIVVCNALARLFLGKEKDVEKNDRIWMGYDFVFSENIGTYYWNKTPVFFTGMLSGQGQMDKGSLERLKWHIRHIKATHSNKLPAKSGFGASLTGN